MSNSTISNQKEDPSDSDSSSSDTAPQTQGNHKQECKIDYRPTR
nr:hypothetical protein [Mycoplasmopsis bovis]